MNQKATVVCGKCGYEFNLELEQDDDPIFSIYHWGNCAECPDCDMTYHVTIDGNKKGTPELPF